MNNFKGTCGECWFWQSHAEGGRVSAVNFGICRNPVGDPSYGHGRSDVNGDETCIHGSYHAPQSAKRLATRAYRLAMLAATLSAGRMSPTGETIMDEDAMLSDAESLLSKAECREIERVSKP